MITRNTIQSLALKLQTTELNIRREYVQHLFLKYFYEQKDTGNIFFKGGTALRLIYRSPRFSEDLDFTASFPYKDNKKNTSLIEDVIVSALTEIKKEGIEAEVNESKNTSGGYLAEITFNLSDQKVSLQLEISFRDKNKKGELTTVVNDFIPPYTLMQLSEQELISEKMQALMSRKKPRDFYDLYFILRANLLTPENKNSLRAVLGILEKVNINFEEELKQFLPKSHWSIIRNFKESLENEIKKSI